MAAPAAPHFARLRESEAVLHLWALALRIATPQYSGADRVAGKAVQIAQRLGRSRGLSRAKPKRC